MISEEPPKKGSDTALRIERLIQGGYGMARSGGEVVLVPLTAPDDLVLLRGVSRRRGVLFGEVGELVEPSPVRRPPPCPMFGTCGGCQLMHINYRDQVLLKVEAVVETLRRVGGIEFAGEVPLVLSPRPLGWRHRVRLHVSGGRLGFYRRESHSLVPWAGCPVLAEGLNRTAMALDGRLTAAARPGLVTGVEAAQSPVDGAVTLFWTLARDADRRAARAVLERAETLLAEEGIGLAGQGFSVEGGAHGRANGGVVLSAGGREVTASPGTFFQVNPFVNDLLVEAVLTRLRSRGTRSLLDLYCGNGNFSLAAALAGIEVTGVESSAAALADARRGAPPSARFVAADVGAFLKRASPGLADAVLADPPRAGLSRAAREGLERLASPLFCYVSCDAASLARDLGRLTRGPYRLVGLSYFDMFPHTAHGETLAVLELHNAASGDARGEASDPRLSFSWAPDRYLSSADHRRGPDLDLIADVSRSLMPSLTLDVATGAGHALVAAAPFSRLCVATDATTAMLKVARRHILGAGARSVRFVLAWAEALALADSSADLVLCRIAAHHFASIPAFLGEVRRVLTQRGRLVLVDSVVPEDGALASFLNRVERLRDPSHKRSLTQREFEEHFKDAGLAVVSAQTFERTHPFQEWASRGGASTETIEMVERMFLEDEEARRHFLVRTDEAGRMVSYTDLKGIWIAGKKESAWTWT